MPIQNLRFAIAQTPFSCQLFIRRKGGRLRERVDDARFGAWRDRLAYTTCWHTEFEEMEKHLKDLGEMDFRLYKSMQEWHNRIADILAYINDVLCPHGFDDIVKAGFAGLRQT
jgi:hypothetical protein